LWDFKYVELPFGRGKNDTDRIGGLVPRWEARSIHIHRNQQNLLKEIYEYRMDDSHSNDDLVDALAYCFHPEMVSPNTGRSFVPAMEIESYGKPYYAPGREYDDNSAMRLIGRVA
ncbi:MAG TPA: hypothetical protein VFO86_06625, partial [Terriglobia bacterium]|nr:hypothetical protein [Terriglobia bacterium]